MAIQSAARALPSPVSSRRARYANDPLYRESAILASRRYYRRKKEVELESCLHSLAFVDSIAELHSVTKPNGSKEDIKGFSVPKTARVLQKLYQTVWRWIKTGMIPPPVLLSTRDRPTAPYPVYHIEEAKILIEEIGNHEREVRYFRKDHRDVTKRIEQRLVNVRESLGFN